MLWNERIIKQPKYVYAKQEREVEEELNSLRMDKSQCEAEFIRDGGQTEETI